MGSKCPLSSLRPSTLNRSGRNWTELAWITDPIIPGGMSLASPDAALRHKAREHVETCIKLAADVGVEILAGPLSSPVGYMTGRRRTPDEWNWAVESSRRR